MATTGHGLNTILRPSDGIWCLLNKPKQAKKTWSNGGSVTNHRHSTKALEVSYPGPCSRHIPFIDSSSEFPVSDLDENHVGFSQFDHPQSSSPWRLMALKNHPHIRFMALAFLRFLPRSIRIP